MANDAKPGAFALRLIENGQPSGDHHLSIGDPVDPDTLFQVASLSKWLTALGVMTLVESGKIDLDAPVDQYLKRWRLPPGDFDNRQVSVRRLLSHTAGLTDGLGYGGFEPGEPIQSLPASLTRAADASPGRDGATRVGEPPGEQWNYSGGGYTLLQLLIEDVTGEPFNTYMQRQVLAPLGMTRSTFELPPQGVENLAGFYDVGGKAATHFRFTATGAASLYTSAADLTRLIQAHLPGPGGAPAGRGVFRPQTLAEMRRPHARQLGADIWGLGLVLYAPNGAGDFIVGHDGNNAPAINTAARFDPASGDGIIVLESGADLLATQIAGEWVLWRTGKVDIFMLQMESRAILQRLLFGGAVILLLGLLAGWRLRPRKPAASS
ncbi:MAG: serine hydrolase domain-containing protein [Phenylobacterium sp.]|nr:serine hydrolase domain-containing protein [Phenylobacterium sp.]